MVKKCLVSELHLAYTIAWRINPEYMWTEVLRHSRGRKSTKCFPLVRYYQHKMQSSHIHTATVEREAMGKPSLFPRETSQFSFSLMRIQAELLSRFYARNFTCLDLYECSSFHRRKENVRFIIVIFYVLKNLL